MQTKENEIVMKADRASSVNEYFPTRNYRPKKTWLQKFRIISVCLKDSSKHFQVHNQLTLYQIFPRKLHQLEFYFK